MKQVNLFVVIIIFFYSILFVLDWMKATIFAVEYHSFFVWFKTFFLVAGGTLIMYFTIQKPFFKTFLIVYLSLWFVYFMLKKVLPLSGIEDLAFQGKIESFYQNITQLFTPLPFIIFWLLNRVFLVQNKPSSDN